MSARSATTKVSLKLILIKRIKMIIQFGKDMEFPERQYLKPDCHSMMQPSRWASSLEIKNHARKGYDIVVLVILNILEVIGLMGYAEGRGHVVCSLDDVEALPAFSGGVCMVCNLLCSHMSIRFG